MKIPVLLTFFVAAVLSALPMSQARADDVSFDVFYTGLADQGDWYNTPDYGYVWQPAAAKSDQWRPYSDGYWAQTDDGWTWVSYENFGWATYHYGRWTRLQDTGWVWVPGYEWGPGWVSWRTSDDYVGWAPLPPQPPANDGGTVATVNYNTVEPEGGYKDTVDQQYDIGPDNYCFVEIRSFGAPVLREVLLPPQRNIIIIENTINVTNIEYRRGGPQVVVFNGGPNFAFISGRVEHPIQRLRIEPTVNFDFAHGPRDRNPNIVKNGVFQIAAPNIAHRPMNFSQIKPPTVKREIQAPKVEHGWSHTGADPATVQRVRQQYQQQAQEHPTRPPGNPAANTTPPANPRERDARATPLARPEATPVASHTPPPKPGATPVARQTPPHRTDEAQPTPAGRPTAPPHHGPNTDEVTHTPAANSTPVHGPTPPRPHGPATNPPGAPRGDDQPEEVRHTPPAHPAAANPPRNSPAETERHPAEVPHTQTPPPAPRQEVRDNKPQPQTKATPDEDKKKKPDPQ